MAGLRGGARPRAGRPPTQPGDWTTLPAEGRTGPAPEWPLEGQSKREVLLWQEQWRRPQAAAWEAAGNTYEVALFVRYLTEAEAPGALAGLRTLTRQLMDSLGLTAPGMRTNRWRIAGSDEDQDDVIDSADAED